MPAAKRIWRPHEKAAVVAGIAGLIMLVAGVSGAGAWNTLRVVVERVVGRGLLLEAVFFVLIALGSLGGLLVIAGGTLLWRQSLDWGRVLILLGSGVGLIGLILFIALHVARGAVPPPGPHWVGFFGIVMAVVARKMGKG